MSDDDQQTNLFEKLAEIHAEIDKVEKRGEGVDSGGRTYSYVQAEDVLDAVRGAMAERKLLLVPSIADASRTKPWQEGGKFLTTVSITYTWIDTVTGEKLACGWKGVAEDDGDKGLYMALTGSHKYFLLGFFQIPTYDDPESRAARARAAQQPTGPTPVPDQAPAAATA